MSFFLNYEVTIMFNHAPLTILEVNIYGGRLGFKPQFLQNDPLLRGRNRRSLRLFEPINMGDCEVREGDHHFVQVKDWEIQPNKTKDGRVIIKMNVRITFAKARGVTYLSRKTGEVVRKIFTDEGEILEARMPAPNETDRLMQYLELNA
jgi:hypothetical protein